jgi:glycosyltransferase involved in cell wall biosynthesis
MLHELPIPAPLGYYGNVFKARSLIRQINPDLLHAHFASGYGTLGRLTRYHPYILSVWGRDVYDFPDKSPLHHRILKKNLSVPEKICSTSQVMADRTRAVGPSTLPPLSIVPFGVDIDTFSPKPMSNGSTNEIVIGTVKKLQEKYGIDILLRGFARARDQMQSRENGSSRLRLSIVGDGPQRAALEQLSCRLGIAECTTFTGKVPHHEVPTRLHKLDIFVAVSRHDSESFGVAIIEALACQCPVVVSDAGGLPEVVEDRKTGIVVPKEDVEATTDAITELVTNSEKRRQMGRAGRRHVKSSYNWTSCLDRMEEVYDSVST